jgi:hypothetical protein
MAVTSRSRPYELLVGGAVIMVVDVEADPTMDYPSFIDLQRYAWTDFGTRSAFRGRR